MNWSMLYLSHRISIVLYLKSAYGKSLNFLVSAKQCFYRGFKSKSCESCPFNRNCFYRLSFGVSLCFLSLERVNVCNTTIEFSLVNHWASWICKFKFVGIVWVCGCVCEDRGFFFGVENTSFVHQPYTRQNSHTHTQCIYALTGDQYCLDWW